VVIYPRLLTTAAVRGMQLAMSAMATALASDTVMEAPDLQVSFEELNELLGLPDVRALEARHVAG